MLSTALAGVTGGPLGVRTVLPLLRIPIPGTTVQAQLQMWRLRVTPPPPQHTHTQDTRSQPTRTARVLGANPPTRAAPRNANRYDAFESVLEVLRVKAAHPDVPQSRYAEVDPEFR